MTPMEAAATIQRIADSGLDIPTSDYRALVEIVQWLASMSADEIEDDEEQQSKEVSTVLCVHCGIRPAIENFLHCEQCEETEHLFQQACGWSDEPAQQSQISAESVKTWLRTLPVEQRQLVIDELVATTLRTLEVSN